MPGMKQLPWCYFFFLIYSDLIQKNVANMITSKASENNYNLSF